MATRTAPPVSPTAWWDPRAQSEGRFSEARAALDFNDPGFAQGEADGMVKRMSRNGARFFFGAYGGSGVADVVRFAGGIEINVNNFVLPTLRRRSYLADEPLIMLRASLSCDVTFAVHGMAPMVFNRPELTLICLPSGVRLTSDGQPGVRQQGVNGIFRPTAFAEVYGLRPDELPPAVREAVDGSRPFGRIVSLPLHHRVASLIADTIDTPLEGEMRALQYAGRLSELVAYTMDAVHHALPAGATAAERAQRPPQRPPQQQPQQQPPRPPQLLRWRDADLAQLALERLARDYRQPPLFAALATELGTNPNKLQAVFKGAFGITMASYCLERRMREAQQLLLEAKLSVAEIAERVGYAHQSNFAAAFSDHLGMSPREYRRHRAPIDLALRSADSLPPRRRP
jgi:AraC-like DNA-binding protein